MGASSRVWNLNHKLYDSEISNGICDAVNIYFFFDIDETECYSLKKILEI